TPTELLLVAAPPAPDDVAAPPAPTDVTVSPELDVEAGSPAPVVSPVVTVTAPVSEPPPVPVAPVVSSVDLQAPLPPPPAASFGLVEPWAQPTITINAAQPSRSPRRSSPCIVAPPSCSHDGSAQRIQALDMPGLCEGRVARGRASRRRRVA